MNTLNKNLRKILKPTLIFGFISFIFLIITRYQGRSSFQFIPENPLILEKHKVDCHYRELDKSNTNLGYCFFQGRIMNNSDKSNTINGLQWILWDKFKLSYSMNGLIIIDGKVIDGDVVSFEQNQTTNNLFFNPHESKNVKIKAKIYLDDVDNIRFFTQMYRHRWNTGSSNDYYSYPIDLIIEDGKNNFFDSSGSLINKDLINFHQTQPKKILANKIQYLRWRFGQIKWLLGL